jgi:hypothetical protein
MSELIRSGSDYSGIYPEPVEGILNAALQWNENFSLFIGF